MAAKAESWQGYNEAAITDRVLEILPELALRGVGSARAHRQDRDDRGNGSSPAPQESARTDQVAEMPAVLEALTGKKLADLATHPAGRRG